ncbi:MAG: caspase family protein [Xanthobacteraceae bacterium]|nr:caspase family protein [Xanthobacteraceae bacterium]
MFRTRFFPLFLFIAFLWAHPAFAGKRVALVIGNSAYQHVNRLGNPAHDSESVAATLKTAGFDVVDLRQNLKVAALRKALRDFSDKATDADIAVVYYAGHGMEIDGANYIIPVDATLEHDIDAYDEAISLDRILAVIEPAKQLRLVILDACRDNPFAKSMKRTVGARAIGRGLAKVEPANPNTMVAFAAKAGSTASDGDSRNSPYTAALVKYIATPGLDLRKAFGFVRDDVMKSTGNRQEPFVYGSLGGDDMALVPKQTVEAPAADPQASVRKDYELALQLGTRAIWEAFLQQYPKGFYASLAQGQLARIAADEARVAATAKAREAEDEKARLQAEGARKAEQAKAAAAVKAAEQARLEAEKALKREQAKAAAAEQARAKAEEAASKAKAAEDKAAQDKPGAERPTQVAALPPAAPAPAKLSAEDLNRGIQSELRRVGCYTGSAHGEWNEAVRQSLTRFNRGAGLSLDVKTASLDTLEIIRNKSSRVCPLTCQHGFRADGERCVAIACKPGTVLNDDNVCERRSLKHEREARKPKPARSHDAAETSAKPQASGQFVCDQGGCRTVRKGCRLVLAQGSGLSDPNRGGLLKSVEVCN